MHTTSWIVVCTLLEKCSPDKKKLLLQYLPCEEQARIKEITPATDDPFATPLSIKQRINKIHYSWLIAFLEPFTEKDQTLILSALDTMQAQKLQRHFHLQQTLLPISAHAKNYLLHTIFHWLISEQKEFLPIEFLPYHPLNVLLTLTKSHLQTLANYLGLHDLAIEIQFIIKARQIHKIQKALSKPQREYLRTLLKKKEPISFTHLNLKSWSGNATVLKSILHHRGFNRLAKALFGCHPSLLWHLCHTLDTGRSKIVRRFLIDINNERIQEILTNQVLELVSIVCNEK